MSSALTKANFGETPKTESLLETEGHRGGPGLQVQEQYCGDKEHHPGDPDQHLRSELPAGRQQSPQIHDAYGEEYIDEVSNKIADELTAQIMSPNFESKLFSNYESSYIGKSQKKKIGSNVASQISDRNTPSKYSATPKGNDFKLDMVTRKVKTGLMIDLPLISSTPKVDKKTNIMMPASMKNSETQKLSLDKFKFPSKMDGGKGPLLIQTSPVSATKEIIEEPFILEEIPKKMPSAKPQGSFKERKNFFKKNFDLAIDTEEINKQFNFGGEKGTKLAK
jgi:hypothetical protein